jgi:hypothetical protein
MIPTDFRDYFLSISTDTQQEIVNSLLSLSRSGSHLEEDKERKAVSCPH